MGAKHGRGDGHPQVDGKLRFLRRLSKSSSHPSHGNAAGEKQRQQEPARALPSRRRCCRKLAGVRPVDPAELQREIVRRPPAPLGIFLQSGGDQVLECCRHCNAYWPWPRIALEDRCGDGRPARSLERPRSGEHLVKDDAEGEDVGAVIERLTLDLLGRHVERGADDGSLRRERVGELNGLRAVDERGRLEQFGEAEIEQLCSLRGDHHVAGLEIAMRDAAAVRVIEGVSDLTSVPQHVSDGERSTGDPVGECLALEVLHDEKLDAIVVAEVEEPADVRMAELRDRTGLALESCRSRGACPGGKDLDGDGAIEARILRAIHLSHSAGPRHLHDGIGPETLIGSERHRESIRASWFSRSR